MKKIIIDILKKYKWRILLLVILLALSIYLLTVPPKIVGAIIDMLYDMEGNKQNIFNHIYYLLLSCIILFAVRVIWKYFETNIGRGFERDLKIKLFERFLKLKLKDIQNIKNGEIMSYFVKDVNEMRIIVYRALSHGARTIFTIIIAIYQMAKGVNINLTIVSMIPILIGCYAVIKIKKYIEISFKKSQEMFTDMSEYIQESTDAIRTTKAYSCEGKDLKDFIKKNRKVYSSNNVVDVYTNLLKASLHTCFGLCYRNHIIIWFKINNRSGKLQ